ncbi:hypothetical protein KIPB_007546 [Kipferlia bialata]|uniref:Uncharacterized protein n=1 Tax=Kipferlia bialata TaxID=797122 RepID=A0A9K3GKS2_9EUKA|nr:hypothetical protein KIPB_007546 [Kipferlia bialata]|eukprot:g7546.t1
MHREGWTRQQLPPSYRAPGIGSALSSVSPDTKAGVIASVLGTIRANPGTRFMFYLSALNLAAHCTRDQVASKYPSCLGSVCRVILAGIGEGARKEFGQVYASREFNYFPDLRKRYASDPRRVGLRLFEESLGDWRGIEYSQSALQYPSASVERDVASGTTAAAVSASQVVSQSGTQVAQLLKRLAEKETMMQQQASTLGAEKRQLFTDLTQTRQQLAAAHKERERLVGMLKAASGNGTAVTGERLDEVIQERDMLRSQLRAVTESLEEREREKQTLSGELHNSMKQASETAERISRLFAKQPQGHTSVNFGIGRPTPSTAAPVALPVLRRSAVSREMSRGSRGSRRAAPLPIPDRPHQRATATSRGGSTRGTSDSQTVVAERLVARGSEGERAHAPVRGRAVPLKATPPSAPHVQSPPGLRNGRFVSRHLYATPPQSLPLVARGDPGSKASPLPLPKPTKPMPLPVPPGHTHSASGYTTY